MDGRMRARGRELDVLGVYQPCANPEPHIEIDRAKALDWLQKGAVPSPTARSVLSDSGVMEALDKGAKPEDLVEAQPETETAEAEAPSEAAEQAEPAKAETAEAESTSSE
jgi:small subunit ribosomal protein S16